MAKGKAEAIANDIIEMGVIQSDEWVRFANEFREIASIADAAGAQLETSEGAYRKTVETFFQRIEDFQREIDILTDGLE